MARRRRIRRRTSITTLLVRLLVLLVVAGVIGVFVAKWWVEKSVRENLDGWKTRVAPFGDLRYLDVSAGFGGDLTVSGLSFYPASDADLPPLITERVTINYPDFPSMIGIGREGPPRTLSALIEGVRLDVGIGGRTISGNPFEAFACGDVDEFTSFDLEQMGFFTPRVAIRAAYELRPATNQVALSAVQSVGDFARIEMEVNAAVAGLQRALNNPGAMIVDKARIAGWRMVFDAKHFNPARNEYCAQQLEVSPVAAADANVEAVVAYLAEAGWQPSDELVGQYRDFMLGDGEWVFSAHPDEPIDPRALAGLGPLQVVERLNLQAAIADRPGTDVVLTQVVSTEEEEFDQGGEVVAGGERRARWRIVTLDELEQYVGSNVLIVTNQRKRYSGRLLELDENEVRIDTRLPGGQAMVPIVRDQIHEIRVYR